MHKYNYSGGLRLILAPLKETKAVTVLVLIKVGSRYEPTRIAGISHFLEHMMFKGTARRPNTLALSRELDRYGAEYNAYTAKDHTGYWIKINAEHLDLALDMLADMLFNSKLDQKEITREKGTIIEEINMYEDNPIMALDFCLDRIIFRGNTLAADEAGTKETVRAMNQKKMIAYRRSHYFLHNMVLVISGNFDKNRCEFLVKKYFTQKATDKKKTGFKKFKSIQKKPQIALKFKETEQVHLALGFLGPSYLARNLIASQLLMIILGGSMSSRLFINIRERQGLCYYIKAGLNVYQDVGNAVIYAGLDKSRIKEAVSLILLELKKIKDKGVTSEELNRAKEFIKGKLILELEDSSAVAEWYGRQELLLGKILTPEEKIKEIEKINKKDIISAAKEIFQRQKMNLALIGPYKEEKDFFELLKI